MSPHRPAPARTSALALAVAIALAPAVIAADGAAAHDELLSTTPAAGSRSPAAPAEVGMVFSEALIEVGAVVVVADAQGVDWADGPVALTGDVARQPLRPGMPEGAYQARWRVVSSDGHPIAGAFDFAVGEDAPTAMPSAPAVAAPAPGPKATAPAETGGGDPPDPAGGSATGPGPDRADAATPVAAGGPGPVVVGALGALAGIALFVGITWIRGRRSA
jgi:methionine-rich copper-binding protein CopC